MCLIPSLLCAVIEIVFYWSVKFTAIQETVSLNSIFSVFNKSWFWLGHSCLGNFTKMSVECREAHQLYEEDLKSFQNLKVPQCQSLDRKDIILLCFNKFCLPSGYSEQIKKCRSPQTKRRLKFGVGGWQYNIKQAEKCLIYAWLSTNKLLQCMRNAIPWSSCQRGH